MSGFNGKITWRQSADPERSGASLYNGYPDGVRATVLVQEVSIGSWGWLLMNEDGDPLQMRNGYTTHLAAMEGSRAWLQIYPHG